MMVMNTLCLVLCFPFIASSNQGDRSLKESKIAGGIGKRIWDVPYMAHIENGLMRICGACQLAAKWLASAAHCFFKKPWRKFTVRVGSSFTMRGGEVHYIRRVIPYPKHSNSTSIHDILLIELWLAIEKAKRHPLDVAEPDDIFPVGTNMTISGWGFMNEEEHYPDAVQSQVVKVITNEECIKAYRRIFEFKKILQPGQFCVSAMAAATCPGDSGGPAVVGNILAGIIIKGASVCRKSKYPNILTRVSDYYYWFQQYISDAE